MAQDIGLHNLKPKPGSRHKKKRLGRGEGSGLGKTSGRGHKGAGSRSGNKRKVNFEGGQMPIHMRMRKQRGPNKKTSMPFEQYGRSHSQHVNLKDLEERFDAGDEVTPDSLRDKGLATRKDIEVKILGMGELSKKLTVRVHRASASARKKIEGAGGSLELLVEPKKKAPAAPRAKADPESAGPAPEDLADQEELNEHEASDAEIQPSAASEEE